MKNLASKAPFPNKEVIKLLLLHQADVNCKDTAGYTAGYTALLHLGGLSFYLKMTKILNSLKF